MHPTLRHKAITQPTLLSTTLLANHQSSVAFFAALGSVLICAVLISSGHGEPPQPIGNYNNADYDNEIVQRYADQIERETCDPLRGLNRCIEGDTTESVSFTPWWEAEVHRPLKCLDATCPEQLDNLLLSPSDSARHGVPTQNPSDASQPDSRAGYLDHDNSFRFDLLELAGMGLRYSPKIRGLTNARLAASSELQRDSAAFDWHAVADSDIVRLSEPVGDNATTPNFTPYRKLATGASFGLEQKNQIGGRFEVKQEIGYTDSNSMIFYPQHQGDSRLTLRYGQPLLRRGGWFYAHQFILISDNQVQQVDADFLSRSQATISGIADLYWDLYAARAMLLIKKENYKRGLSIYDYLEHRQTFDATPQQLLDAKAAITQRSTGVLLMQSQMRSVESRIRATVAAPELRNCQSAELIPEESPISLPCEVELSEVKLRALRHRPEILKAREKINETSIKLGIAKNGKLPSLDLVLETHVMGLDGGSDLGESFVRQFAVGEPSYSAGLKLDVPIGNRAARAEFRRREYDYQIAVTELVSTIEQIMAEVEIAVNHHRTAFNELSCTQSALIARRNAVELMFSRWKTLSSDGEVGSIVLQQLLTAQNNLESAEVAFLTALVEYNRSMTTLKKVDGTLLQFRSTTCPSTDPETLAMSLRPQHCADNRYEEALPTLDRFLNDPEQDDTQRQYEPTPAPAVQSQSTATHRASVRIMPWPDDTLRRLPPVADEESHPAEVRATTSLVKPLPPVDAPPLCRIPVSLQ